MRLLDWLLLGLIILIALAMLKKESGKKCLGGKKPGPAETQVRRVLEEAGFELLGVQPALTVNMTIQGRPHRFEMKTDYLAARGGRRYLVRLRRNAQPVRLNSKAWRNALLRDVLLFGTSGALVLDLGRESVSEVRFQI